MIIKLFIITNTSCNLRCKYCYYGEERSAPGYLDFTKLDEFIDLKIDSISITGGEPLLNPFLKKYLEIARDKCEKIILSTNGLLISDGTIATLKKYNIKKIFISLDSVDDEFHDIQRCGTRKIVMASVRKLLKNNFRVQIASVITSENIENMEKVEKFCLKNEIKYYPQPIFTKDKSGKLDLKNVSAARWKKLLSSRADAPRTKEFIKRYRDFSLKVGGQVGGECPLSQALVIDVNGDVKRCFYSGAIANIKDTKLSKIIFKKTSGRCFGDQCFQYSL